MLADRTSRPDGTTTDATADADEDAARIRFHGRRHGRRLRPGRARLLDDLLPSLQIELPPAGTRLRQQDLFSRPIDELWLEIGFGAGEHLAWQLANHPAVGIIGCEPYVNGIASLLHLIDAENGPRVRVWPDDARLLLPALPDAAIGRAFLLFPDPWPKRRHEARRFVQPDTLGMLARVMRPGAELRLASDDPGLVDWMLWQARAHPAFAWTAARPSDWRTRPADWPATRYERKQLRGQPAFLRFVRL